MEVSSKTSWFLIALITAMGAALVVWQAIAPPVAVSEPIVNVAKNTNANTQALTPTTTPSTPARENNTTPLLSYDEAVRQYEGKRIQIENCILTPNKTAVINNTTIMLDNRSADGQEVSIDGTIHRLWGYEFKLVTLKSATLPHTAIIDCQSGEDIAKNVGQIIIR